uniref:Uncharacterized protein n=1 Tax=Leersia perrieri TaxID=77586 RepID=A0A0D9XK30_9ORYZ
MHPLPPLLAAKPCAPFLLHKCCVSGRRCPRSSATAPSLSFHRQQRSLHASSDGCSSLLAGRSSVNILCVHCKLPVLYILYILAVLLVIPLTCLTCLLGVFGRKPHFAINCHA